MNDLIKRSDVIDELMHITPYKRYHNGEYVLLLNKKECLAAIKSVQSADRPQGEWIKTANIGIYECQYCKKRFRIGLDYNFCPNCGCRMKGADDE